MNKIWHSFIQNFMKRTHPQQSLNFSILKLYNNNKIIHKRKNRSWLKFVQYRIHHIVVIVATIFKIRRKIIDHSPLPIDCIVKSAFSVLHPYIFICKKTILIYSEFVSEYCNRMLAYVSNNGVPRNIYTREKKTQFFFLS